MDKSPSQRENDFFMFFVLNSGIQKLASGNCGQRWSDSTRRQQAVRLQNKKRLAGINCGAREQAQAESEAESFISKKIPKTINVFGT